MLRAICHQFHWWARRSILRVDKCPYKHIVITWLEHRGLFKNSFFDKQPTSPIRIQDDRLFFRTAHSQRVPAPKTFAWRRYLICARVMTSEKLTNSWLTCDNKTGRQWFGQTFFVEFLGKFDHSDVIGTNPYLVLYASNTNIQNIAA